MANQIKMAVRDSIVTLYDKGWSQRRIAKALEIDWETVGRHIRLEQPGSSNPAIPPAGVEANPAIVPIGKCGRKSDCRPYHLVILEGVEIGLNCLTVLVCLPVLKALN